MIEDKSISLKMPENEDEQFWIKTLDVASADVKTFKDALKLNEAIVDMAKAKLAKYSK